ncbi:MAG: hypothetical protein E7446_07030 [Ruminococcaceae bacterium]|nr:hypothetical protein [Oscillospiraceae bacterium]
MKTRLCSIILSIVILILILCGCGKKSGTTLPPLSALAPLPDSTIIEIVQNYDHDTLLVNWGQPVRIMEGNTGAVWKLDDTRDLLLFYNEYQKVFAAQIK